MILRVVICHAHAVLSPDPPRCRYRPGPLRGEVLEAYPEIESLLGPLFEALDLATLQRLNGDVAVNGLDSRRVAADFLDGLFGLAALAWRPPGATAVAGPGTRHAATDGAAGLACPGGGPGVLQGRRA